MFFLNLDWKCYIGWRGSPFKWEGVWCPFMFTLWFWWQMVGKVRWLRWFNMNGLDQGLLWKHFFSYKVSEIPWLNQLHLLIGCVVIGGAKDSVYTHLEEASHYLHLSNCGIIYTHSVIALFSRLMCKPIQYINKKWSFDSVKETYIMTGWWIKHWGVWTIIGALWWQKGCGFDVLWLFMKGFCRIYLKLHSVAQGGEVWSVKSRRLSLQVIWFCQQHRGL